MGYSIIPKHKTGDCCQCPAKNTEVVKVKKSTYCLSCHAHNKAQEQIERSKRRESAKRQGFRVRNELAAPRGSEDYFMAERQALMMDCDFVFSRLVRMSAADKSGFCECYTCGRRLHWSMQQCGHFVPRANTQTRWDLRNARVQDKYCNENLRGNLEVFEQKLEEEHKGLANQLREIAREPYKHTRDELKQILFDLRARLKLVENKFKYNESNMY